MYPQFILYLLKLIKYQEKIILALVSIILGKSVARGLYDEPINKPYRKLEVDTMPVIEKLEKFDYLKLLEAYELKHKKRLKPVQRRKNSVVKVPENITCPQCSAPSTYLYANNGGKGQYCCKVCDCHFSQKNRFLKEAVIKCPHCLKTLERIKERKDFYVYKCKNNQCTYYTQKLSQMTKLEKERFKQDPQAFKVRYIFREFDLDFDPLAKESPVQPKIGSSTLPLNLTQYPWAKFRKTKSGVKLHLRLVFMDKDSVYPDQMVITPAHEHDRNQLEVLVDDQEAMYVSSTVAMLTMNVLIE